jgi:hypothetical protein
MNSSQLFSPVWAAFEAGEIVVAFDARFAFSHSICGGCAELHLPPPASAPTAWSEPQRRGSS